MPGSANFEIGHKIEMRRAIKSSVVLAANAEGDRLFQMCYSPGKE